MPSAACGPPAHRRRLARRGVPVLGLEVATDAGAPTADVERLVVTLFEQEGASLVRLARLFVDDRNAAEDLVQEAFIRLARAAPTASRTRPQAAAYLRSIVLNLARDHNRRGLVSLRHHLPFDDVQAGSRTRSCCATTSAGDRRAARASPSPARLPRAALLRRARHRRHRGDARRVAQLGEDPSPTGPGALEQRLAEPVEPEPERREHPRGRAARALLDGAPTVDESHDLFARVQLSIEDDRRLRQRRRRASPGRGLLVGALAAVVRRHRSARRKGGSWTGGYWS